MDEKEIYRYHAFYYTHGLFSEGGRKIHIGHEDSRKVLCGLDKETRLCSGIYLQKPFETLPKYLSQPDPAKEICQKCKRIFIGKL